MTNTVSIEKKHVNITIGVAVAAAIAVVGAGFSWGSKIENYRIALKTLQADVKEIREEDIGDLRKQVEKLRNLEIHATLKSIDRRLEVIEKSSMMKASRWYDHGRSRPAQPDQ